MTMNYYLFALLLLSRPLQSAWDYSDHGKTWSQTYPECGADKAEDQSAPIDFLSFKNFPPQKSYLFYPIYKAASYSSQVANYTLTYEGDFGNLFVSLPLASDEQTSGAAFKIEFHVPAEHLMDGARADVEMQIYHSIPQTQNKVGLRNALIFSAFFNKTSDASHPVLNFLQNKENQIDLNRLADFTYSFSRDMYSYIGTMTKPPCTGDVLWFMANKVQNISQAQIDWITQQTPSGNYRDLQAETVFVMYKHIAWNDMK